MAKKYIISKEQLRKMKLGSIREDRKSQGYFDGRFVSRSEQSKKNYSRKNKHRNRED